MSRFRSMLVPGAVLLGAALGAAWLASPGGTRGHANTGHPPRAAAQALPDAAPEVMARGRRIYEACVSCHLPDGKGVPGMNPPLAGTHISDAPPGRLVRVMLHGMTGPVTIAGEEYDGVMAPGQVESDEDIAAVLTYIRRSWGNRGSAITPESVKKVREETADRLEPWTAEELADVKE